MKFTFALFAAFMLPSSLGGQIERSGAIIDEEWTVESIPGEPIVRVRDVRIIGTVTIGAGVTVEGEGTIEVVGRVVSEGTENRPVVLTSVSDGEFRGLHLVDAVGKSFLRRTTFRSSADFAIKLDNSSLELDGCSILESAAGGILATGRSNVVMRSSKDSGNPGVGIQTESGVNLALIESEISQNRAGGVCAEDGTTLIDRSRISENTIHGKTAKGAGVAILGGEARITDTSIDRNTLVTATRSEGAGLFIRGQLWLRRTLVRGNLSTSESIGPCVGCAVVANSLGGGLYLDGEAEIIACRFSDNSATSNAQHTGCCGTGRATSRGGGIYIENGIAQLHASLVDHNEIAASGSHHQTSDGGGIFVAANGAVGIVHATIAYNQDYGLQSNGQSTVDSSILYFNSNTEEFEGDVQVQFTNARGITETDGNFAGNPGFCSDQTLRITERSLPVDRGNPSKEFEDDCLWALGSRRSDCGAYAGPFCSDWGPDCKCTSACSEEPFIRGDCNTDANVSISDTIFTLRALFLGGGESDCDDACDSNDDGTVNITDAVFVLNFLFLGGLSPEPPFTSCGADATSDELNCTSFPACE